MPKYRQHAPDPQPGEPPTHDDRYDFRRLVADPTSDAPAIIRRHVDLLVADGLLPTKAWKLAMADHRLVWPLPVTSGVVTFTEPAPSWTGSTTRTTYGFRCECGWEETQLSKGGAKRSRDAHHRFHVDQRAADRALVERQTQVAG